MAMRNVPAHHGVDLRAVANPGRAARAAAAAEQVEEWIPPVLTAVATKGEGIEELVSAFDRHARYLESSSELKARRRRRLREQVVDVVEHRTRRRLWSDERVLAYIDAELPRMENGEQSPYGIADEILKLGANALAGTNS
jgi:LAO/AO transport system kinase